MGRDVKNLHMNELYQSRREFVSIRLAIINVELNKVNVHVMYEYIS